MSRAFFLPEMLLCVAIEKGGYNQQELPNGAVVSAGLLMNVEKELFINF